MQRILLLLLSLVAGYVDACTFLALFGLFVAQVTGSFVAAGTGLFEHETGLLLKSLAIPVFMIGGAATTLLIWMLRGRHSSVWTWTLGLEAVLLTAFMSIGLAGSPFSDPDQPAALAASLCGLAAMGAQAAAVRLLRPGAPSTNVMTFNTIQFAIDATHLLLGWLRPGPSEEGAAHSECARLRTRVFDSLAVMAGFFVGVVAGAFALLHFGFICLALVIALLICLILLARRDRL